MSCRAPFLLGRSEAARLRAAASVHDVGGQGRAVRRQGDAHRLWNAIAPSLALVMLSVNRLGPPRTQRLRPAQDREISVVIWFDTLVEVAFFASQDS